MVKVGDQTLITNSYNSGTWTLQRQTYGNGDYWANTYNTADELTKRYTNVTDTLGIGFELVYNSKGMLMQVLKKAVTISGDSVTWGSLLGTENYVYDAYDRLIRTIRTDGSYNLIGESRWTLDNNDNVTALTSRYVVNGTLKTRIYNYTYNADQQPTQTTYSTIKETIGYDGFGRRSEKDVYRSDVLRLQTQYAYRNVDSTYTTEQIAQLTHTYNNTTLTHAYTYDANGNILTDTVNGDTIEYTYDALNRLTWEKNAAAELAWQYTYDLGGNILSKTEYTYVNGITSNPQTITYTYGDSEWPDLLTAWNNQTITYDGIGNPTNYLGATLEWQGGRQLKGMTSGNNILSFAYNDSGLRTEKTITHANSGLSETKQYIWNGSRLVAEIGEEYSFYFHYNGAGEMIGFTYRVEDNGSGSPDEAEHIFVKNQQGDVEKVLRPWDQAVVAEYSYDAWGNLLDWSGPLAERNPIRYRGYYYDTETGFYYLQSRYYDPQTGRFINADGLITTSQGLMSYNMFAYCLDNPVNGVDKTGEDVYGIGGSVSGGAGVGGGCSTVIIWDDKGNKAEIEIFSYGGGTPNMGMSVDFLYSNADDIFEFIDSFSLTSGGSIPFLTINSIQGVTRTGKQIMGIIISPGISMIPAELHAYLGTIEIKDILYYKGTLVPDNVTSLFFRDLPDEYMNHIHGFLANKGTRLRNFKVKNQTIS